MADLSNQLKDYLEHAVERFDVNSLPVHLEPDGGARVGERAWWSTRPAWVVAAAAAIILLLLIGGSNVLFNALRSVPPADDITTTTVESEVPTTSGDVVAAPTTIEQVEVDVASSVVPGLGTLRWELIEGDEMSLPTSIEASPEGGYVSYDNAKAWRSADGVAWVLEGASPELADYRWVWRSGDWAIGIDEDRRDLFEKVEGDWVAIALPEPEYPQVEGLTWQHNMDLPVEIGERRIVDVTAIGQVTWSDVYGMFEVDCGESEPCEMEPWAEWSEAAETFRISSPDDGSELAVLAAQIDGDVVVFADSVTGETVHTVTTTPALPAATIIEGLKRGQGPVYAGGWMGSGGEAWSWVDFPWVGPSRVLEVPDGGLAVFDFAFDWQSPTPLVAATVWKSANGVDWTNHGSPGFPTDGAEFAWVDEQSGQLQARVITGFDEGTNSETAELWRSTDGLEWSLHESEFPAWSSEFETDFGLVVNAMPQSTSLFWVSTDGSTWHEVLGPPGSHEPAGAGYAAAGAVDDFIWLAVGEEGGDRRLWIGRFGDD